MNSQDSNSSSDANDVVIDIDRFAPSLSFPGLFGNDLPCEVEIGIGKGRFLIHTALNNHDVNYIGIEIRKKYLRIAEERIRKRGIRNVRLLRADAAVLFSHFFQDRSLQACYILFPDPWPKKRHHKRRLLNSGFLGTMERCLAPGGRMHFVSDFEEYYERVVELLHGCAGLEITSHGNFQEGRTYEPVRTNYEVKYMEEGRPIYRVTVERTTGR